MTVRAPLLRLEHEDGLRVGGVQMMHDGPEHRILRIFVECGERVDLSAAVCAWRHGAASLVVTAAKHRLQARVRVPERLLSEDGRYFCAAAIDGRHVSVILAREDWQRFGSDRPERSGALIIGETLEG